MLSQSHPTYIQNLNVNFLHARAKGDQAAFALAVVTMLMVPPLVPIGMSNGFLLLPKALNHDPKVCSR